MSDDHRVVWKDRVGLNQLWAKDLQVCSETFGTELYATSVDRLRHDIINIKDGPALRDTIEEYIKNDLEKFKEKEYEEWKREDYFMRTSLMEEDEFRKINTMANEMLHSFMVQLLEDHGFAFYESEYSGEYDKM